MPLHRQDNSTRSLRRLPATLDRLPTVVRAPRTDAIYNCHAYLTKVPVAAIKPFIEALTEREEVVADIFAGVGTMGMESLSRGAHSCVFYESSAEIHELLQINVRTIAPDANAIC